MNDPKQTVPQTPVETELAKLKSDRWADFLHDPEVARRAADQETHKAAVQAIKWKKEHGVYPWEAPESAANQHIARQQAEWLRQAGIDPEKGRAEYLARIEEAIRQIESRGKPDTRGR